jgi:hypothetical protein
MPERAHEKRKRRRVRTRHAAWIRNSPNAKLIPCVLWDQSDTGARIAAAHSNKLPDVFTLINDKEAAPRACRIVWRKGSAVGVQFIESIDEADAIAAAPSRKPQQAEPARPLFEGIKVSVGALQGESAPRSGLSIAGVALGLLLLLVILTIVFFIAGQEGGTGNAWAAEVCQQADNMCRHPEFSGGASVLMALVYFAAKGMEH